MRNLKHVTATAAVALCASVGVIDSAKAADFVYSGGGTLASVVYRQLMDTWLFPMVTPLGCGATATDLSGNLAAIFYAAEGSGAGKRALVNHNGSTSGSIGLGTATPGLPPPYTFASSCTTSPAWAGYPFFHFAGSDDVITQADLTTYNNNSGPANWGKILQIPAFIAPVVIGYNPAGLSLPASGLNLTRNMVCGIFSGHVTDWSDTIFSTSGASGGPLTASSLPITVVHRADGSGTTFLFSNAMKEQCEGIVGPNNAHASDLTKSLWELSWSDRNVGTSVCPALQTTKGSNLLNWPDLVNTQCGTSFPIANPGGGTFTSATHTDQVACTIMLTNSGKGGIGYVSPDFSKLVISTLTSCTTPGTAAPSASNVQNQYSVDNDPVGGPFTFTAPSATNAQNAMASVTPSFPTDAALTNPLNWSTQGIVPNPAGQNSYPIAGFTWMDFYQCYNGATAAGNVLGEIESYLQFYFGGSSPGTAATILNNNGFAIDPAAWSDQVANLALSSSARFGTGGAGVCTGIPGA